MVAILYDTYYAGIHPSIMKSIYRYCLYIITGLWGLASTRLPTVPTIAFTTSSNGTYHISSVKWIAFPEKLSGYRDDSGETLIPPTLSEFAGTFADDIFHVLAQRPTVSTAGDELTDAIYLTIDESNEYVDASGRPTSEGYTLSITPTGVNISGASPLGLWWGSRTLLQLAILTDGALPMGNVVDAPGWSVRGMMLDAGRHYYPPEFLVELCSYMSFYKQNTLHLHLSDNLYNNVDLYSREDSLGLYARFRLWSASTEVAGLNTHKNESYTKEQFEHIQSACAQRGVTIIPEIEAPGHALPIVQWKPEIGLSTDLSLLNISHPETLPTMRTIWGVFLHWFQSKTVHIGADEYTADVNDYNRFVDEMATFISDKAGKHTRIWGTFPPKSTYNNISTEVSIQHWEFFEDNPLFDYIRNNYSVLNSDDTFYVVNKWSGSYPQTVPIEKTFTGDPASHARWQPNIFDAKNSTNNPARDSPRVLGSIVPLWNDFGPNASVYSEAYYAWREGIPALADKQWGGDLTADEFDLVLPVLQGLIPGQNLERHIPSSSTTIFHYSSSKLSTVARGSDTNVSAAQLTVPDQSPNAYDAHTDCPMTPDVQTFTINHNCFFRTPFTSKGRDYTLTLKLRIHTADEDATLISGADSSLMLTPNLTLFASGNYYRLNSTVPIGAWVNLQLSGRGNQTFASVQTTTREAVFPGVDDRAEKEEEFLAVLGINGQNLVWAPIAIEAPIAQIGGGGDPGWSGQLAELRLSSKV
ncbi:glycoside hydrolase family 20 protein [Xylariaceae sp. FL1272]|nr:glycoside hydrolase family 20 protein [Xylariaceae sp. FL1272]